MMQIKIVTMRVIVFISVILPFSLIVLSKISSVTSVAISTTGKNTTVIAKDKKKSNGTETKKKDTKNKKKKDDKSDGGKDGSGDGGSGSSVSGTGQVDSGMEDIGSMDIAAPAPDGASGDPVTSDAPAGEPEQ
jgi:hypothetical protein